MAGPRILLTNDDGIDAPGLAVLEAIAHALSDDVWVVAPAGNQSGAGHRFTFGRELEAEDRGPGRFSIEHASPADCVVFGVTHLLDGRRPDIVLSGVNNGQNLGDVIHCSGTAAGAREGVLQGAIGIALSQGIDYEARKGVVWDNSATHGAELVRRIVGLHAGEDVFYNVNFPSGDLIAAPAIRAVPHQRFARSPFGYYPSDTAGKFFISIPATPTPLDPHADFEVLRTSRAITVTPVTLRQTDMAVVARLAADLG